MGAINPPLSGRLANNAKEQGTSQYGSGLGGKPGEQVLPRRHHLLPLNLPAFLPRFDIPGER